MGDEVPQKGEPILFTDVESLPAEEGDPIWEILKTQIVTVEDESTEDRSARIEKLRTNSALYAATGRVWMIGVADRNEETQIFRGDGSPEQEKGVLEAFGEYLGQFEDPWFVGHNIEGYDIPFLKVRALRHGLGSLARKIGGPRSLKPWKRRVLDTQSIWPRTGADRSSYRDGVRGLARLDTICAVLGIPRQEGVMGKDVYAAYLSGEGDEVEKHLRYDILQLREVFKRVWPLI